MLYAITVIICNEACGINSFSTVIKRKGIFSQFSNGNYRKLYLTMAKRILDIAISFYRYMIVA